MCKSARLKCAKVRDWNVQKCKIENVQKCENKNVQTREIENVQMCDIENMQIRNIENVKIKKIIEIRWLIIRLSFRRDIFRFLLDSVLDDVMCFCAVRIIINARQKSSILKTAHGAWLHGMKNKSDYVWKRITKM